MSDSLLTKRALAESMKELMAKHPMEKIKVKDIVELCNLNRQSFYYHFKDKYELVNWIYYTDFFAELKNYPETAGWKLIEKVCSFFYQNRTFYSNALKVKGQNSFSEYFAEMFNPVIQTYFDEVFKGDSNQIFYATFFSDAIRVAITRWLLEDTKNTPHEFVRLMKTAATGIAYKLIEELKMEQNQDECLTICPDKN